MYYIWKEWKENLRGKGLWLACSVVVIVSISMLFQASVLSYDEGFYVLLINLFDTLSYFIPLFSLFLGAFSLFQEKEQKTLIMLLTRQESFLSFLFKKSIGVHSVLIGPMIIWFFVYLVLLKFFVQIDIGGYFLFLLAIIVILLVFTQIGLFIGSFCRSRMQIVGFAIFVWFYFFFLHDFALLSYLPNVSYENVKLFSLVYFLNPIPAIRMFFESGLGVYSLGHMSKLLQSFMWTKPVIFMSGNLLFWVILSFLLAVFFHRKEGSE